jgi:hypothetical protein
VISYAIVQHSSSYVQAMVIDAVCSCLDVAKPGGPMDASEGGIRIIKNCVMVELNPRSQL